MKGLPVFVLLRGYCRIGDCSLFVWLFLAITALCLLGCGSRVPAYTPEPTQPLDIHRVLVVPFKNGAKGYDVGTSVRCPICGALFVTGPVEGAADKYMTRQLMAFLKSETEYTLIPPGMAEGVRSRMLSEDIRISERDLLVEMGRRLQADAVISGMIYRFRQRIGTVFSVDTPASVAFGIHFIRVADGRLIWVGHLDETQKPLSEDLFKVSTFVKRGGGWLTAEELATFGLNEVMATLP